MINWFKRRKQKRKSYRSNEHWIHSLSSEPDEEAIAELRRILIRGLKPALHRYLDREPEQFVEDVAQDALLKILDRLDTFRGESQFVTWAMKIAVREGLSELRRKKWNDVSLEELGNSRSDKKNDEIHSPGFATSARGPEQSTHENMILTTVLEMIEKELSEKQKTAIMALMVQDLPVTVVAEQMNMKRNALYKLVHDARLNLKKKMKAAGMDPEELLKEL